MGIMKRNIIVSIAILLRKNLYKSKEHKVIKKSLFFSCILYTIIFNIKTSLITFNKLFDI